LQAFVRKLHDKIQKPHILQGCSAGVEAAQERGVTQSCTGDELSQLALNPGGVGDDELQGNLTDEPAFNDVIGQEDASEPSRSQEAGQAKGIIDNLTLELLPPTFVHNVTRIAGGHFAGNYCKNRSD
jgi:hypothetical protein